MNGLLKSVVSGLVLSLSVTGAIAADLPEPPVIEYEPGPEFVEIGSSWYIRADIGYKIYAEPSLGRTGEEWINSAADHTGLVGGGVGYRWNDSLRTDLTLDYEFPTNIDGNAPCGGCGAGLYSAESADLSVWTVLFNGYFDIGTWSGFTPYVGAGVGASYVKVDNVAFVNPNGATGTYEGDEKWNFSWALMAGTSYEVSENLAIDAGYRYLHIGEGKTKPVNGNGITAPIQYKDLAAHEFRMGVRYSLN